MYSSRLRNSIEKHFQVCGFEGKKFATLVRREKVKTQAWNYRSANLHIAHLQIYIYIVDYNFSTKYRKTRYHNTFLRCNIDLQIYILHIFNPRMNNSPNTSILVDTTNDSHEIL